MKSGIYSESLNKTLPRAFPGCTLRDRYRVLPLVGKLTLTPPCHLEAAWRLHTEIQPLGFSYILNKSYPTRDIFL